MAPWSSGGTPLLLPILHPCVLLRGTGTAVCRRPAVALPPWRRYQTERTDDAATADEEAPTVAYPPSRLNPAPDDYAMASFADKATLTVHAGVGGQGCISFLRDLFLPDGPPNGGDGGHGGNVYIQAVPGETSLHKIARRRVMRAGRGKHGQGSARNGQRGDDVIVTVPVGTIVTEVSRIDPVADGIIVGKARHAARKRKRQLAAAVVAAAHAEEIAADDAEEQRLKTDERLRLEQRLRQEQEDDEEAEAAWLRRRWVVYPGLSSSEVKNIEFPRLPRRDRTLAQPPPPVYLDLARPTAQPILLASGGVGGLGNPHFLSRKMPRPVVATKGEAAVSMTINLELRLLADVGLVGLPNAGKSTLLRALSNSRARVGSWAFTTLQPNIGTVVLDSNRGRPLVAVRPASSDGSSDTGESTDTLPPRTRFTVADIPGLIEGAHLDKGLGIAFLRHVERAGVLAFVVDLGAGDAVKAVKALWTEVGLYARMRDEEELQREREARIEWGDRPAGHDDDDLSALSWTSGSDVAAQTPELAIAGKPWFVVGTKGDLPGAQDNFQRLQNYLDRITSGQELHPSGIRGGWTEKLAAVPVSAIKGHGIDHIVHWTVGLLDQ